MPNFGVDTDIKDNFADLKAAETQLGKKWDWKLLPAKHFELDKGVPGFQAQQASNPVLDADVISTLGHEAEASSRLGHVWDPYRDEKEE